MGSVQIGGDTRQEAVLHWPRTSSCSARHVIWVKMPNQGQVVQRSRCGDSSGGSRCSTLSFSNISQAPGAYLHFAWGHFHSSEMAVLVCVWVCAEPSRSSPRPCHCAQGIGTIRCITQRHISLVEASRSSTPKDKHVAFTKSRINE